MTLNFPGPYELRIHYEIYNRPHTQRLNCFIVGGPDAISDFDSVNVIYRNGSSGVLSTVVDAWVQLLRPAYDSVNSVFTIAEIWKYEAGTFLSEFLASYDLGSVLGSGGTPNPASQAIASFRTQEGGNMYIHLMECNLNPGPVLSYAASSAGYQAIIDSVLAGTNPWQARDTSFPFSFRHWLPGRNEALFKKINR